MSDTTKKLQGQVADSQKKRGELKAKMAEHDAKIKEYLGGIKLLKDAKAGGKAMPDVDNVIAGHQRNFEKMTEKRQKVKVEFDKYAKAFETYTEQLSLYTSGKAVLEADLKAKIIDKKQYENSKKKLKETIKIT
jgi:chromosome segregation ATPase